jgi:hypothetical protein
MTLHPELFLRILAGTLLSGVSTERIIGAIVGYPEVERARVEAS